MAKENIEYALCDFCHKAKPSKELENIRVIYRKCQDCKIGNLEKERDIPPEQKSVGAGTVEKKRPVGGQPPEFLKEAFRPPDEFSGKPPVKKEPDTGTPLPKKEEVVSKTETNVKSQSTEPSTVQSPESGKSS